eukprot:12752175-Heterocapsa_arctica.AAC.1
MDRRTGGQADRRTGGQTGRRTGRQAHRQTDRCRGGDPPPDHLHRYHEHCQGPAACDMWH